MFHRVTEVAPSHCYWSQKYSVLPGYFVRLIDTLIDWDYNIVSMNEVGRRITEASRSAGRFICLTFDDGYRDNYDVVFSICASRGIPMMVYLTTGFIRRTDPMWWLGLEKIIAENDRLEFPWHGVIQHYPTRTPAQKRKAYAATAGLLVAASRRYRQWVCKELGTNYSVCFMELTDSNTLTPQMIRDMRASGLVEFGAHTVSHANLLRLSLSDAHYEIAESRRDLEDLLEGKVRHFAFPYGRADAAGPRELALCRELGFGTATTTRIGNLFPGHREWMHALPRLPIGGEYQDNSVAAILLSGTYSALRQRVSRALVTV